MALTCGPTAALAATNGNGGVLGFVEDARGLPVAGAVVSLFGSGLGTTGLVTLTDSTGRFSLPALPSGAYTLRAIKNGDAASTARQVVVVPGRDSLLTVSLAAAAERVAAGREAVRTAAENRRELEWLLRHKARSVLEDRAPVAEDADGDAAPAYAALGFDGSLEIMTAPPEQDGQDRTSLVRLEGRLSESSRWSLGGVVAERQSATWRMAANFAWEPGGGHMIEASTGYGTRTLPFDGLGFRPRDRGVGALSVQDRWDVTDLLTATVGGRFTYVGFLEQTHAFDPVLAVEGRVAPTTVLRASVAHRTLPPGGDVLALNAVATAPALQFSVLEPDTSAERLVRYELGMDESIGGRTRVGAFAYYEGVRDQIVNVVEGSSLRVVNGGRAGARGLGVHVRRRFGDALNGSMTYTYGRSWRDDLPHRPAAWRDGDFHDIAARVETSIPATDTRVAAFYRVNVVLPEAGSEHGSSLTNSRFDVQVSQGLPFLGTLTRAEWDVLVAVRNLFYEHAEAGLLDEVVVINPPKRILGGISVRF
jgi:hypothetical protein